MNESNKHHIAATHSTCMLNMKNDVSWVKENRFISLCFKRCSRCCWASIQRYACITYILVLCWNYFFSFILPCVCFHIGFVSLIIIIVLMKMSSGFISNTLNSVNIFLLLFLCCFSSFSPFKHHFFSLIFCFAHSVFFLSFAQKSEAQKNCHV